MIKLSRAKKGQYNLVYRGHCPNIGTFMRKAMDPDRRLATGRGSPGIFESGGEVFIVRQYLHGGWLRGITKGMFVGERRAANELKLTLYLEESRFPVVEALGYISRKKVFANDLFFITYYMKDAVDLVDYFRSSDSRSRLRLAGRLGQLFFRLGQLGIYHPDLHLRNILVNKSGEIFFLDFDKARRKKISPGDYEKMFWRLDRYVHKYEVDFGLPVNDRERLIFLRRFERLSGQKIISGMKMKREAKQKSARLGWLIEHILYKTRKPE